MVNTRKNITKEVKTLWAGRAWVHAKYLNQCVRERIPLVLVHKNETMTIQPDDFKTAFDRNKVVEDKFNATLTHKQYGIVWRPTQQSLL